MNIERHPPVSNKALFGLLVMLTSWQISLLALLVERGRIPSLVFAAAGFVATIFVVTGGRKAATPYWRSSRPAIFPNPYSHSRWYRNWGQASSRSALSKTDASGRHAFAHYFPVVSTVRTGPRQIRKPSRESE